MAAAVMVKYWLLVLALVNITYFNCKLGKADEDYPEVGGTTVDPAHPEVGGATADPAHPEVGGATADPSYPEVGGATADPANPEVGGATADPVHPEVGGATADPAQAVAKALLCFHDNYIYSSCEESYRLTQSGNLNVPPEYTDQFCNGPCQAETHLVLDCIANIFLHFEFYNKATAQDVRETIKTGCGYGSERGNFNVARHLKAEESKANKMTIYVPMLILLGQCLLF